jgi:hypothetical protein
MDGDTIISAIIGAFAEKVMRDVNHPAFPDQVLIDEIAAKYTVRFDGSDFILVPR